jgi:hypothetical protein
LISSLAATDEVAEEEEEVEVEEGVVWGWVERQTQSHFVVCITREHPSSWGFTSATL